MPDTPTALDSNSLPTATSIIASLPTSISIKGPYEEAITEAIKLFSKLVDKQTPEQAAHLWEIHIQHQERLLAAGEGIRDAFAKLFHRGQ